MFKGALWVKQLCYTAARMQAETALLAVEGESRLFPRFDLGSRAVHMHTHSLLVIMTSQGKLVATC